MTYPIPTQNTKERRGVSVCVYVCGLEWQKGWRWGLHPKKGFLSRWQLGDWQDAILLWNCVSQPVSLPVRQPLVPLNLAFCWVVTGLALTLHVADVINCTKKPKWGGNLPRWTLCHNTQTGSPFDGIKDKTALCPLSFALLSLIPTYTPTPTTVLRTFVYSDSISWMVVLALICKKQVWSWYGNEIFLPMCVCQSKSSRERS